MAKKNDDAQKILDEVDTVSAEPKATKKSQDLTIPIRFSWKTVSILLGVLLIVSVILNISGGTLTGNAVKGISTDEAADDVLSFIRQNVQGANVEITGKTIDNGLHKISANLNGQPLEIYTTMDGKLMFPQVIDLTGNAVAPQQQQPQQQQPTANVAKSDKPVVELFVMSHCPFGTQSEKGILPVAELLGDKIDFEIKFVNYAMHGETELIEQMNQVCIKDEQSDKWFDYLWCFLENEDRAKCIGEANVDQTKLDKCTTKLDTDFKIMELFADQSTWSGGRYPQFNVYDEDNKAYGVRGSPTLVINGEQASSGRDSASYLRTVCAAFNNAPEECSKELPATQPSPGFGLDTGGSGPTTAATCG
jgi:hypothetical protein